MKIVKYVITTISIFLIFVFGINFFASIQGNDQTFFGTLSLIFQQPMFLILLIFLSMLLTIIVFSNNKRSLNDIKSEVVGDGQFGTSRFLTEKEKKENFTYEKYEGSTTNGVVVGTDEQGVLIDHSDANVLVIAPPDSGKTKSVALPTLNNNLMVMKNASENAASIITTDVKGELYEETSQAYKDAGFNVYRLDFRNVLESIGYNFMYLTNKYVDLSRNSNDKQERLHAEALAERYAKILANMINGELENTSGGSDGSSKFFDATSIGLMTSLVLVVSKHGYEGERHLISVFRLILELNGLIEGSSEVNQKNRLEAIFDLFPSEERAEYFAGAAVKADVRTSMNVFASAISKLNQFLDVEIEQLISGDENELDVYDFIEHPSIIYLVIPDEDPTRHFMGSLFLRNFINELIEYAMTFSKKRLPRDVIVLADEFGQLPKISYFDQIMSAARSRGIRIIIIIQSFFQLELRYGKVVAGLLRAVCQVVLFFAIAPSDNQTKKDLSEMLGSYTTKSGSTNISHTNSSNNSTSSGINEQLSKRELLDQSEIGRIPRGEIIVQKYGMYPMQSKVKMASEIPEWQQFFVGELKTTIKDILPIEALTEGKLSVRIGQQRAEHPKYAWEDYFPSIRESEDEKVDAAEIKAAKRIMPMMTLIEHPETRLAAVGFIESNMFSELYEFAKEKTDTVPEKFTKIVGEILTKEGIL